MYLEQQRLRHYIQALCPQIPLCWLWGMFRRWTRSDSLEPYYGFGNGSAMRVSPVGFAFDTMEEVLAEAKRSAEGIKEAQTVAAAVLLARHGESKRRIKDFIEKNFGYDLAEL